MAAQNSPAVPALKPSYPSKAEAVAAVAPIGQPFKVRLNGDGFKVDGHSAWRWDGKPKNWTAYA